MPTTTNTENSYIINMVHLCNSARKSNFLEILNRGSALTELQKLMKKNKLKRRVKK